MYIYTGKNVFDWRTTFRHELTTPPQSVRASFQRA